MGAVLAGRVCTVSDGSQWEQHIRLAITAQSPVSFERQEGAEMTRAAREVLSDCRTALEMLQGEADPDRWRVHWAGGVALLRAVGHVLLNVDQPANAELTKIASAAHRRWRSEGSADAVYREFILEERNNILKEYRSKVHPLAKVPVVVRLKLMNPATGEISYHEQPADFDENLFRPLVEGYGEGEDARDVFEEALCWWERELDALDAELLNRSKGRFDAEPVTEAGPLSPKTGV